MGRVGREIALRMAKKSYFEVGQYVLATPGIARRLHGPQDKIAEDQAHIDQSRLIHESDIS
jgi:hypothetical protein